MIRLVLVEDLCTTISLNSEYTSKIQGFHRSSFLSPPRLRCCGPFSFAASFSISYETYTKTSRKINNYNSISRLRESVQNCSVCAKLLTMKINRTCGDKMGLGVGHHCLSQHGSGTASNMNRSTTVVNGVTSFSFQPLALKIFSKSSVLLSSALKAVNIVRS